MKKTFLVISLLVVSFTAQAGIFSALRDSSREQIPTQVLSLEADGKNFRMYIYPAPYNSDYICVMIAGTQKGGNSCYPRKDKELLQ